ncbi:DUF3592 domain-containing protein [Candidatus Gracilibacteria bacterium]|nr:DUF3592 domain-containing protein [Candidatus Gracilibacteria bacterium]
MQFPKVIITILILGGSVFCAVGGFFMKENLVYILDGKKIDGTITQVLTSEGDDGKTMYSHTYSYKDSNGNIHNGQTSGSSSWNSYNKGEKIELLYDDKSGKAKVNSFSQLYLVGIFLIVGAIELSIGIWIIVKYFRRKKEIQILISSGKLLQTKISSINKTNISINNRVTYYINSQIENENDGKIYVFKSELLHFNPLSIEEGGNINVFVNNYNYKRYYMDTRELEKQYIVA